MSFAEKFLEYMTVVGLSYAKLSKQTGIAVGTLCSWGRGVREPNAKHLCEIAYFFGSDPNEMNGKLRSWTSCKTCISKLWWLKRESI